MYPDVTPKDIDMLQQVIGGSIYYQGYPNWGLPPFVYWGHYVGKKLNMNMMFSSEVGPKLVATKVKRRKDHWFRT